ncbi:HWE histidine kinase domain-containing protein [Sphingosinicella rhizophila]|uniref:histidine kinase n=1 Tax=Sphingosinicella rhizophila TaxID=3050082 RepID=A0ABU3Q8P0_9SPHN|nr:HWE histidine kinase domain-containing protein [Sphingosinicella sp. GR2756]MDT9599775.1 HWE histidine kinase domain-containing protein [Sphingosinicella sp. GR2756]
MNQSYSRVDLTNCDREPIHILGAIQPIGFLIALTQDWVIARVSANVADFLGSGPEELIGRPLAEILSSEAIHMLRNRTAILRGADSVERIFGCKLLDDDRAYDIAVHASRDLTVVEAEPGSDEHGDATSTVRSMVARLDTVEDLPAFFSEGARQVRGLTGYDRVMVYRFAADGSGEVVAESVRSGIGSFLGLHYPATDIPQQARELYRRNLLRIITDVNAEPVPIVPERDADGDPLDLSLSILRAVSPIHIEYLKNMGVGASMSISIIVEGKLWGLFACHHYSARTITFERRSVSELFAQMFSLRLESRERKETVEFERRARDISDQLLGAVASDETLLNDPDWLSSILTTTIPADGVGVWINGNHASSGMTPDSGDFARIISALSVLPPGEIHATDCIASLVPEPEGFAAPVAGMLAIPISRNSRDYVVLFRSELVRSVRWGGDPHKPTELGPNGPRLTPRQSFEEWKETVRGRSQPFTQSELRVAETLRATLIEVVLRLSDEASAERQQASERQELLIAELNHRVRNILGVIRGLIRQSKPAEGASVEDFVRLVDGRVHALARAHNQITDDHWGPAPLRALIDAEAAAFLADRADRIKVEGPLVLLNPQAFSTMALVLHELVTNSAKYGALSDHGTVHVTWSRDDEGDLRIEWKESEGPPVKPPTRQGFGTTIINRSIPYDLGGKAKIDYPPTGVEASFRIPGRHVSEPRDHKGPAIKFPEPAPVVADSSSDRILEGLDLLLVEDSLIIALDAEDILTRLGAAQIATAASVEAAFDEIRLQPPALALLDINLGDQNSYAIADRLAALGIPFIFATGYGEQAQLPAPHRERKVVQKPYTYSNLARALGALVESRAGSDQDGA